MKCIVGCVDILHKVDIENVGVLVNIYVWHTLYVCVERESADSINIHTVNMSVCTQPKLIPSILWHVNGQW